MQAPPAHIPALDGLRGLAILLVLACHANIFTVWGPGAIGRYGDLISSAGWVGVDLFFVLSGFLITGILLATKGSKAYYKSFFARRFLRIFPLYYVFLGVLFVWKHQLYSVPGMASLLLYYYNLYAVAIGGHLPFVNSLWSLAVEEQFYLVWPFVVASCTNKTLTRICMAGIALALVLRLIILPNSTVFQSAYYITPCRMDNLLLGSLLAVWRRDSTTWKLVQRAATPVMTISAILILTIAVWTGHFSDTVLTGQLGPFRHTSILVVGPGITFFALFFGGLLVKCIRQGPVERLFLNEPLRRLGKYSYGMYMLHWLFLVLMKNQVMRRLDPHLPAYTSPYVFVILVVASTFGAAYASFHLMEKRFLSLKRLFPARPEASS